MASCSRIRPLLPRAVEGELAPEESLALARHLPRCTLCRIRLARERRLAELLATMEDAVPVERGFADGIMRALPDGPPPAPRGAVPWARRYRGAKLAAIAGLLGTSGWLVGQAVRVEARRLAHGGEAPWSVRGGNSLAEVVDGVADLLMAGLSGIGAGLDPGLGAWWTPGVGSAVTLTPSLFVMVAVWTALAWSLPAWSRSRPR